MERHQFKVTINAPRERVWEVLWGDSTYPQWTTPFAEGSRVETDWKTGSKVLFLDGHGHGMVSMIAENIPNEVMSFRHLGTFNNGIEDMYEATRKGWTGAIEHYKLQSADGKTHLTIDQDLEGENKEQFLKIWPQALEKLKSISEQGDSKELISEGADEIRRH